MVIIVLQTWLAIVVCIMIVYGIRHWTFTRNRVVGSQRPYYGDLHDSELPAISVIVPMHNEAGVVRGVLESLLNTVYPRDRMEIIPVDDGSQDDTTRILLEYAKEYPCIRPVFVVEDMRGKPNALNNALRAAKHNVVLVFDADYTPGPGLLKELAIAFIDPEVGAVMGRVIPKNTPRNLLTRLLSLERSGGYQVDQQARYNLDLLPQYGGTVGGFRRDVLFELGGFDPRTLAEDTDLTARLFISGWKVVYANRAECYEEVPENWDVRFRQLRRWSRGHNRALFNNIGKLILSKKSTAAQKLDGVLLLGVYLIPIILLSGYAADVALFLMGAMPLWGGILIVFFVIAYNAFGNFAPIYQIAAAELLDGSTERLYVLPFMFAMFLFNSWAVTSGILDAIGDVLKNRSAKWDKTRRARTTDGITKQEHVVLG